MNLLELLGIREVLCKIIFLLQFSEGNNYYFAVRAVDTHSRKGQYSIPGNISL